MENTLTLDTEMYSVYSNWQLYFSPNIENIAKAGRISFKKSIV